MITLYIIKLSKVTETAKHGDLKKKMWIFQKNRFVTVTAIGVINGIIKHYGLNSKTYWSLISKP